MLVLPAILGPLGRVHEGFTFILLNKVEKMIGILYIILRVDDSIVLDYSNWMFRRPVRNMKSCVRTSRGHSGADTHLWIMFVGSKVLSFLSEARVLRQPIHWISIRVIYCYTPESVRQVKKRSRDSLPTGM